MSPPHSVQKWLTLTAHSLATFSNAIGFGIYFTNASTFAIYYDVDESIISYTFFIGTISQILLCIPAMKLVEWRLDYSMMCGAFLSMAGYFVQYTAQSNFIVMCCMVLEAFGQAILLPMSAYLAERWFPLEQRSFAIAISFYSNLFGFAFGAIFTTIYVTTPQRIVKELLIICIISTCFFVISIVIVKNKPKILMEKYKSISWKQLKELWKFRYNTYLILMASVFLGLSWNFLFQMSYLADLFSPVKLGILMMTWIISGSLLGLILSKLCIKWVRKSGNFTPYDRTAKVIVLIGLLGYLLMGFCYAYQFSSFVGYIFLVIFIGIGSIGYYGLMFMSIIQTFYPLSSLLIGNLIIVGASFYSALASSLDFFTQYNSFFILAAVGFLPFVFIAVSYRSDFKRYRCYLDEQKYEYVTLRIEDNRSHFNDRKYE